MLLLYALLIGAVCGLRSMTAPAVVCWGAHLGWISLAGTPFAFLAHPASLVIFTVLALGEIIADKLPSIPSRVTPGPLAVRAIFGALSAAALVAAVQLPLWYGAVLGMLGAVLGAWIGFLSRRALSRRLLDLAVALTEDAIAVGGGFFLVSRF